MHWKVFGGNTGMFSLSYKQPIHEWLL